MDHTASIWLAFADDIVRPEDAWYGELSSYHPGGVQIALFDGSVHFVSMTIDREILRRLAYPSDGQLVGSF